MASPILQILVLKKVRDRLASYLNFEDLKALRAASKELNAIVLNETNFKDRAVLVVSPPVLASRAARYVNLRLNVEDVDTKTLSWLQQVLPELKSVELVMGDGASLNLIWKLSTVLQQCQQLQTLKLNAQLIRFIPSSEISGIQKVLKNLEALEITEFVPECAQEVQQQLQQTQSLKSIKIHGSWGCGPVEDIDAEVMDVVKALKGSKDSLECIEIDDHTLWSPVLKVLRDQGHVVEFPSLKSVKIVVRRVEEGNTAENLLKFLERHSGLESLDLCITARVPAKLFSVLVSKLKGLRKLRIVTKGLEQGDSSGWNFLGEFERLEDFEFSLQKTERYDDNFGDFIKLFKHLPRTLKTLSLRGIADYSGEEFLLEGLEVATLNPRIVTHLDVGASGLLVDDETLQMIIQQFRWLEYLDISNSVCTDDGFTGSDMGDGGDGSGVSIKSLKGLRTLKMTYCKDVTDAVCGDALQFLDLIYIDLVKIQITKKGLLLVLKNNPSLTEVLTDLSLSKEEIGKHPRLKTVWAGPKLELNRFTMHPSIDKAELSESEHESDDDEDFLND